MLEAQLFELDLKYLWHPFTQMSEYENVDPLIIEKGFGAKVWDVNGKEYYEGVSSLWNVTLGHSNPKIVEMLKAQLDRLSYSTLFGAANVPAILFAAKLVSHCPKSLGKVFFSSGGSEAVETALKIAIQYWVNIGNKRKKRMIYFNNAYHGVTLGALSVMGIRSDREKFEPLLQGYKSFDYAYCYRCSCEKKTETCQMECLEPLKNELSCFSEEYAALIVEPVQGAGGVIPPPKGYLKKLRELCDDYDVLMIVDEVATGFGRTGKMWGCDHDGVTPDIMTIAKGITAGYLPLGASLTTNKIYETFCGNQNSIFMHGNTFAGTPLSCVAGIANLESFEKDEIILRINTLGSVLREHLTSLLEHENVGDVRGSGMMYGVEIVKNKATKEKYPEHLAVGRKIIYEARKRGLIVRPLGNVVPLFPPYCCEVEDIIEIVSILKKSIEIIMPTINRDLNGV